MKKMREWFEDAVHQLFRMAMPFLMLFVSFILTSEVAELIADTATLPAWTTTIIMVVMSMGFVGMAITAANGVVRWASIWLLWRQGMADKPDTTEVLVGGLFFAAYVSAVLGILFALELERSAWVAVLAFEMLNIGMAFVVGYGNVREEVKAQLTLDEIVKLVGEAKASLEQARTRRKKVGTSLASLETQAAEAGTKLASVNDSVEQRVTEMAQAETAMEQRAAGIEQSETALKQRVTEMAQAETAMEQRETEMAQAETAMEQRETEMAQAETAMEQRETEMVVVETAMERLDGLHSDVVRYIGGSGVAMDAIAVAHGVGKATVSRLVKKMSGAEK